MVCRKTSTMAHYLAITVLFLLFTNSSGAVPVEEWNRTFGKAYSQETLSFVQTLDDGYIMAGLISTNQTGNYTDAWLIKSDSRGKMLWDRTYAGKRIAKVSYTPDGGYLLKGVSYDSDFWLMKTDANGQEQWNRTLIVNNITYFIDIEDTSDGGSIIAAVEALPGNPPWWNSRLIKVDASGFEQWNITLKRPHEFEVKSVQQTTDGGYVLAGSTILSYGYYPLPGIPLMDYGNYDAVVIKTDNYGNQQWEKTFGWWGGIEGAKSVAQTTDGGYIIEGLKAGFRLFEPHRGYNIWLIKIDKSGNEQWNRDLGKSWGPDFSTIIQSFDDGYIFSSSTKNEIDEIYGTDQINDWLIKTDVNGNIQWKKVLGGTTKDKAMPKTGYYINETSDQGYILAGSTESYGSGNSDAWLVKISGDKANVR